MFLLLRDLYYLLTQAFLREELQDHFQEQPLLAPIDNQASQNLNRKKCRLSHENVSLLRDFLKLNGERQITSKTKTELAAVTKLKFDQVDSWIKRERKKLKTLQICQADEAEYTT